MSGRNNNLNSIFAMVVIITVTTIVISCANKLDTSIDPDQITDAPTQVVMNMSAAQTENGKVKMRMSTTKMERYERGKNHTEEFFKEGFNLKVFNEEGMLETEINSHEALHLTKDGNEQWSAYGNVVIDNYIKGERIVTDTLYWDKDKERIHTDCYVTLSSPQGFMQGYGLESDDRARNAQLLRPFDSFGVVSEDSTGGSYIDSVNFIGPKYMGKR